MKTKIRKKKAGNVKLASSLPKTKVNKKPQSKPPVTSLKISEDVRFPEVMALEKLSVITGHWLSDVKFFEDEVRFLNSLINKYFAWLTEDENIKSTKEIARALSALEKKRKETEEKIHHHSQEYGRIIENPFSHDQNEFRNEHAQLEQELNELVKSFRSIKQKTFALTESIIQSEKVKHLLIDQQEPSA